MDLTFRQGVVLGLIMADRFHKNIPAMLAGVTNLEEAFDTGCSLGQMLEKEFGSRALPEFPQGAPREAFDEVNAIIVELLSAGIL